MCLMKVKKRKLIRTDKVVEAWKVIRVWPWTKVMQSPVRNTTLERGKWMKADTTRQIAPDYGTFRYRAGWHAWAEKIDANCASGGTYECHHVMRVLLRKVRTIGVQKLYGIERKVYVADEMYIPTEEEEQALQIAESRPEKPPKTRDEILDEVIAELDSM